MSKIKKTIWIDDDTFDAIRTWQDEIKAPSFSHAVEEMLVSAMDRMRRDENSEGAGVVLWLTFSLGCAAAFCMGVGIGMSLPR